MRTGVFKKLRPEAREKAKAAARRSGQSVEEWLDNAITQSAAEADVDEDMFEEDDDAVQARLDELTRKIDRLTATGPAAYAPLRKRNAPAAAPEETDHLTEMVERLDRRLDQFVNFAQTMPSVARRPAAENPQLKQAQKAGPLKQAMAEITARQRMLRGEPALPPEPPAPAPAARLREAPMPMAAQVDAQYAHAAGHEAEAAASVPHHPGYGAHHPAYAAPQAVHAMQAMPQHAGYPAPMPQTMHQAAMHQAPMPQTMPHAAAPMAMPAYAVPRAAAPQQAYAPPPQPVPAAIPLPAQDLSGLESQLRTITTQIETLRKPGVEQAINALREELSQIAHMLTDAMPRHVIDAIDAQIQNLAQRLSEGRQAGVGDEVLTSIEQHLGEIHGALRSLTPAENLDGFNETVHALADRIDMIVAQKDPASFAQLEEAINNLRAMSTHIASNDTVQQLASQVQALANKVDQIAYTSSGDAALAHLEQRISSLADAIAARNQSGSSVPQHLEQLVDSLTHKIEQIQHSRTDGVATKHLEDRIVQLAAKLDASDSRLANLEAVERGLGELLAQTERLTRAQEKQQQTQQQPAPAAPQSTEHVDALRRDVARTQDSLESVHSTLAILVDRLGAIETGMRERADAAQTHLPPAPTLNQPVDVAVAQIVAAAADLQQQHAQPAAQAYVPPVAAQSHTPDDIVRQAERAFDRHHFEQPQQIPAHEAPPVAVDTPPPAPAKSAPQPKQAAKPALPPRRSQPIDPDLPPDHPIEPGMARPTASRSTMTMVAPPSSPASRIAASEAALNHGRAPVMNDSGNPSDFIAAARRAAKAAELDIGAQVPAEPRANAAAPAASRFAFGRPSKSNILGKLKSLMIASSVVAIVVGGYYIIGSALDNTPGVSKPETMAPALPEGATPDAPAGDAGSSFKLLAPNSTIEMPPKATAPVPDARKTGNGDVTNSIGRTGDAGQKAVYADKLPAAFSQTLRDAAASGDATAAYEIANRYAEGQGVASSLEEAARWFERAAQRGIAPAQFRLGSLYEKGQGVRRDLKLARSLYLAAAEQGNAKAMHNLAVLYAEGVEGKPDYKTASEWFRKASSYGVSDSQYNLAILYARGLGVEKSLTDAYKWFSLAAAQGDKEAAKKRDEVGGRLDPTARTNAENAVKTWTPQLQPPQAIRVATPPGGWDRVSENTAQPAVRQIKIGSR